MAYIGRQQDGFGVRSRFIYTATGGQTTFTTDDSNNALSYSDGAYVDVYLNGVLLDPADYTATSLTSIVLDSGATASDILEVIVYDVFSVFSGTFTNGITASEATVTGDLTVDTNTLFVDSTNNRVGIGTSSPGRTLATKSSSVTVANFESTSGTAGLISFSDSNTTDDVHVRAGAVGDNFVLQAGGSERMRIDSSGNVGIGTTSPAVNLDVSGASADVRVAPSTTTNSAYYRAVNGAGQAYIGLDNSTGGLGGAYSLNFWHSGAYPVVFATNNTERMRLDSSGNLLVGTTGLPSSTNKGTALRPVSLDRTIIQMSSASVSTGVELIQFRNPNGQVGYIATNANSTTYATSSDYRLKENVTDITDGIIRVKQLNPLRFNFISDASTIVDGFLAHEVSDVVPEAITGKKDAMMDEEYEVTPAVLDDDGNVVTEAVMGTRSVPDYQGIDQSKLVPLLTAALQEAITKIETLEIQRADLETRLTTLENA